MGVDILRTRLVMVAVSIVGLAAAAGNARASIVTLTGSDFDVVYDTTQLNQFGAPTLVGDNLFFTPSNFRAESLNGAGVVTDNSTANGIYLVAHAGFQFGSLSISEFGDYILSGAGSTVSVGGQLRAFNASNPIYTQTSDNIAVSGATPLNSADGANHDWVASASINTATPTIIPPISGGVDPWLSGASTVGLTLQNNLSAYTSPTDSDIRRAMVEKKFAGVEIMVAPVPLPAALWLFVSGLGLVGSMRGGGRISPAAAGL